MKDIDYEELIVVEGKNDAHAVRKALGNVDVIWTEGFGLTKEKLDYISEMSKRRGVVICTDPDYVGMQIREKISRRIPEAKHVYISRACAVRGNDIGLENVSPEEIKKAFSKMLTEKRTENVLTMKDLLDNGLAGREGAAEKRAALGKVLGIGDTNAKQFLLRANRFAVSRKEFLDAITRLERTGY